MREFRKVQKARGPYVIVATLVAMILGAFVMASGNLIFVVVGVGLFIFAASGIYTFWKKEEWSLQIDSGILSWSYPRWPKSSGTINLGDVTKADIHDNRVTFTFKNGATQKMTLLWSGCVFRDHLKEYFPHIEVKFSAGS